MASLSHHLPSLLLLLNLLDAATNGDSVKPAIPACSSFDCGNGQIIGYPFWQQGNQDEYCGYPGFAISCYGQQPLLHLFDHLYQVKKISYPKNTLIATFRDLSDGNIECLRYGLKRSYAFMVGAIPEFDWRKYCESTMRVPVAVKTGNRRDGLSGDDFGRALKEGFELTWRSPESGCRSCEASGGFCGSGNGPNQKPFCFCNDGKRYDVCSDKGDVTLAFEPDFITIGALICGGLIMAATVFYIVQKKKISLQKPAFSRIPTGGK
ncbi:LEAF RUST 10 DISEASE-RESISTANCE LOCUS RECEPTOR-LIKE PROTEIN KINASE-like 1.2 [Rhododendron vialii]|uniref:LEAF RUST 10 DISEASE-RESISTANCE LOCUS RECEPTOR-LIKE PROTEIN KINASE-like 1.2 n=1 Tax=Rhododendron vialii TaxID=182163 RepID=UPI00265D87E2|nr:LEAF RUST 10 DISEASE-RESISTANCE LOCUS RECEPTOR-LIKE PROTEIN KINASE-like 1.2 [Rhododendron vialii]